jgi:hypothetical protein
MAIEIISTVAAQTASVGTALSATRTVELTPLRNSGVSSFSQSQNNAQLEVRFKDALHKHDSVLGAPQSVEVPPAMKGMFNALDQINNEAKSVSDFAANAESSGGQLTPGEIVQLTMKCQEFMFQAQLTSNIANRSSDGVSQLFRQQG